MDAGPTRVFISYSHDSDAHSQRVLSLANTLRENGIDAWIDQYDPNPPQGWPSWMRRQVRDAKFVVVVCTPVYRSRFDREETSGVGKGAKWEGAIITHALYEKESENRKFIPVIMSPTDVASRPDVLQPYTYFDLSTNLGMEGLYRLLTGQPAVAPPPIGSLQTLKQKPSAAGMFKLGKGKTGDRASSSTGRRLKGRLAYITNVRGVTIELRVANTSEHAVHMEAPKLVVRAPEPKVKAARGAGKKRTPKVMHAATEINFIPVRPYTGPIQPTESRAFFLAYDAIPFLKHEYESLLRPKISIEVESGVGTELSLSDPDTCELVLGLIGKELKKPTSKPSPTNQIQISPIQMRKVMRLVKKRASDEADRPYKVFPPQILLDNPQLQDDPSVLEKLSGHNFLVRFSDGDQEKLSVIELLAMTYQLIVISLHMEEIHNKLTVSKIDEANVNLKTTFDPSILGKRDMPVILLSKLQLEPTSSESALGFVRVPSKE